MPHFFTIGHSNYAAAEFGDLLIANGVTAIADVRSSPFSRFSPQYNREEIRASLKSIGVSYVFLGKELGARSKDPAVYENGKVSYDRLAATDLFRFGIDRLLKGSASHSIALMCAERDPIECHRSLLVGRALAATGCQISHIRPDGTCESNEGLLDRLLSVHGLPNSDMFRSRADLVAEAHAKQACRVAFVDESMMELG